MRRHRKCRPIDKRNADQRTGRTRREVLRGLLGASLAAYGARLGLRSAVAESLAVSPGLADRKLIVVVFGGGTRFSESFGDPEHRHIPHLWNDMAPRGTLLTNMRVEHRVVHPNCTASIATGHWEWDDNDWSRPVAHPTVFEICRRARKRPDTAAWAFVYASILANMGHSSAGGYGLDFAPNVVEPPTIPRSTAEEMDRLMLRAGATGSVEAQLDAARECARLARSTSLISTRGLRSASAREFLDCRYEAWKATTGTTSHDAFLTEGAITCMQTFEPGVLLVAYGEIDCAHYGSWSRYVESIRRTDALTWRLWQATEQHPAYRGRTLMLILPDHGRELERPGGPGFIHHSDFYTNLDADEGCRRVWMLAIGPGVAAGRRIDEPCPTTATAATGLEYLGLPPSPEAEPSILAMLA